MTTAGSPEGARYPGRAAAILVGGASARMGTDKALLQVGGAALLARTAALLRPLVDELLVVARDPAPYAGFGLRVVTDLLPARGSLVGIHAALARAERPLVLCVACDMPQIEPAVLGLLLGADAGGFDALVPRPQGRPEPLLALYARSALPAIEASVAAGRLRIVDALAGLRVRFVEGAELAAADVSGRSFVNVNTPEELAAARGEAAAAPAHPGALRRGVVRWRDGALGPEEVSVAREIPVTLRLNGREIVTLLASDDALDFLAVGFLKAEGFLSRREDLVAVRVDAETTTVEVTATGVDPLAERFFERRAVTSGCGKGVTFTHGLDALQARPAPPGPRVAAEQLRRLMHGLLHGSGLYREAGGVHSAALANPERIEIFRDDIGRHNAVDKIHGECFLRGIPVADKILLTTGRISSEILVKASKLGVPILVSRSSPTDLALELADRVGITVVGQVRGGGLTVYAGPQRVKS